MEALNILHSESLLDLEEYMNPMLTSHTISSGGRPSNADNPSSTSISEQGD